MGFRDHLPLDLYNKRIDPARANGDRSIELDKRLGQATKQAAKAAKATKEPKK